MNLTHCVTRDWKKMERRSSDKEHFYNKHL